MAMVYGWAMGVDIGGRGELDDSFEDFIVKVQVMVVSINLS
jgi:hypothetical protein